MGENYDVIIIGSGAGGGTLAHALAGTGKRILLLERGDFLPREMDNWDPKPVFVDGKYISKDTWFDRDGKPFQPQVHYFVGGATKLYGAALYRLRPQDFGEIKHVSGISPAWPLSYDDFEPWYSKAEQLYQVHGNGGENHAYWLLSLFHPAASDAVEWSQGNYALTTRGGRVESDERWGDYKKQTRMVAEGSVLVASAEPRGSAADVAPEGFPHPVYRSGFALAIRISLRTAP